MKCDDYVNLMSDYVDRELPADDRKLWEKHFEDCPPCRDFFQSFRSSVELVEFMRTEKCPEAVAKRLESLIVEKARAKAKG